MQRLEDRSIRRGLSEYRKAVYFEPDRNVVIVYYKVEAIFKNNIVGATALSPHQPLRILCVSPEIFSIEFSFAGPSFLQLTSKKSFDYLYELFVHFLNTLPVSSISASQHRYLDRLLNTKPSELAGSLTNQREALLSSFRRVITYLQPYWEEPVAHTKGIVDLSLSNITLLNQSVSIVDLDHFIEIPKETMMGFFCGDYDCESRFQVNPEELYPPLSSYHFWEGVLARWCIEILNPLIVDYNTSKYVKDLKCRIDWLFQKIR